MGLKDFIKETANTFEDVEVNWLKFNLNETKELVVLSRINDEDDNFNSDSDLNYYGVITKWGANLKDSEGKVRYLNLPILDESQHNSEKSNNEFFSMVDVLGLQDMVQPKFLMWVADANSEDEDNPDIYLWNPSTVVITVLMELEEKYGSLLGRTLSVRKPAKKKDSLVITPYGVSKKGFVGEPFDVSSIEFPNKLGDNIYYTTIDSQIRFLNSVKDSFITFMENEGHPVDEWFFTIDDEKGNGTLKPQFMKIRSDEFEI